MLCVHVAITEQHLTELWLFCRVQHDWGEKCSRENSRQKDFLMFNQDMLYMFNELYNFWKNVYNHCCLYKC